MSRMGVEASKGRSTAGAHAASGIALFPAIDILDRNVVRLLQGDYAKTTVYGDDPAAMVEPFKAAGASWVHVVDLNGARGESGVNDEVIKRLCAVGGIGVEVGGGVRSLERIEELAAMGVRRIVLGTKLARDPEFARQAAERFGDLLVAGIDARNGRVAVQGWQEDGGMDAFDLVARLQEWGYRHLVYTDIARDGMQTGIDPDLYADGGLSRGGLRRRELARRHARGLRAGAGRGGRRHHRARALRGRVLAGGRAGGGRRRIARGGAHAVGRQGPLVACGADIARQRAVSRADANDAGRHAEPSKAKWHSLPREIGTMARRMAPAEKEGKRCSPNA